MSDTSLTIDGVRADGFSNETPTPTRGAEVTLSLIFETSRVQPTSGYRYSDTDGTGGALYPMLYSEPDPDYRWRYEQLRKYLAFATQQAITVGSTDRGVPWVRETLPDRAPVNSLVVGVVPGEDVVDVDGFWGAIVGGDDKSKPLSDDYPQRSLELRMRYLADLDEYADRAELFDDLGAEVV